MATDRTLTPAELEEAEERFKKMLDVAGLPVRSSYAPREVAVLVGTSLTSVYRMVASGEITAIYPRSRIRVDYPSLLAFITEEKELL